MQGVRQKMLLELWLQDFRFTKKSINTSPDNVKDIVLATAVLHNYLRVDSEKNHAAKHYSHVEHRHEVEDVLQEAFQRLTHWPRSQ